MTNPLDSQCSRVPLNYRFTVNEETIHSDNVEIYGLNNAAFDTINAIWTYDIFMRYHDENKIAGKISDWGVTKPLSGPSTMDNICHRDLWWTVSNGIFETPEGHFFDVDYVRAGIGEKEQALFLEAFYQSGAVSRETGNSNWHPDVFLYMGEFSQLAGAYRIFSDSERNVNEYVTAVKKSFANLYDQTCDQWDRKEFFFEGVAPLNLTEEQITKALDDLAFYGDDQQMACIIKAAWYARKAHAISETQPENAQRYIRLAREELEKILCALPEQSSNPSEDYELGRILTKIEDPEREDLVWWIIQKIYDFGVPSKTAQECYESDPYHRYVVNEAGTECVLCPDDQITEDGKICQALTKSAEECFNMEPQGTHVLSEDQTECLPCEEPTPMTKDGIECVGKKTTKKKAKKDKSTDVIPVKTEPQTNSGIPIGISNPYGGKTQ